MDNYNPYQPSNPNEQDIDSIVNEFKDYTPEAPQQTYAPQQGYTPKFQAPPQQQSRQWAQPVQQKSSKGGKTVLIAVLCFLLVGLLAVGGYFGIKMLSNRQQEPTEAPTTEAPVETTTEAPAMESESQETELPTEESTEPVEETESYVPDTELLEVMAANTDVVGRLTYGNDYSLYITQCGDNVYYLTHDYEKKSNWVGAPFFDYRNSLNPRDTNLMIHGHNMKNNTIFSNLISFYKEDFTRKYPIVTFATGNRLETYVIYAVVDVEVDPDTSTYFKITEWNFDTDSAFNDYVGYYQSHSRFELPVDVKPDDQLLTLSTCNYIGVNGRLLVCCRMLRDGETAQDFLDLMAQ